MSKLFRFGDVGSRTADRQSDRVERVLGRLLARRRPRRRWYTVEVTSS